MARALRPLLILGANNPETVRVVMALNDHQPRFSIAGFLDNDPAKSGTVFWGFPVLGPSAVAGDSRWRHAALVNSITRNPAIRRDTTKELTSHARQSGAELINLIHPSVDTRLVKLGTGLVVHELVVIQPGSVIGDNVALNTRAVVSHECVLEDHVFMAPAATLAGIVHVGECAMLGVGSAVLPRLSIGPGALVGGGAVVIRDVPSDTVVAGNPAKPSGRLTGWSRTASA